jgi:hypothetical protein
VLKKQSDSDSVRRATRARRMKPHVGQYMNTAYTNTGIAVCNIRVYICLSYQRIYSYIYECNPSSTLRACSICLERLARLTLSIHFRSPEVSASSARSYRFDVCCVSSARQVYESKCSSCFSSLRRARQSLYSVRVLSAEAAVSFLGWKLAGARSAKPEMKHVRCPIAGLVFNRK